MNQLFYLKRFFIKLKPNIMILTTHWNFVYLGCLTLRLVSSIKIRYAFGKYEHRAGISDYTIYIHSWSDECTRCTMSISIKIENVESYTLFHPFIPDISILFNCTLFENLNSILLYKIYKWTGIISVMLLKYGNDKNTFPLNTTINWVVFISYDK